MYKHYIRLYKSYETGIYTVIQNHDTTKITSQYEGCNKEDGHFFTQLCYNRVIKYIDHFSGNILPLVW